MMAQLSDILKEKIDKIGGKAALGRALGGIHGQTIFQYTQGVVPSLDFAIKWKQAFNENLIDLMFEKTETQKTIEQDKLEPELKDKYINALEQLNTCQQERAQLKDELETLKKFGHATGAEQLKKEELKH